MNKNKIRNGGLTEEAEQLTASHAPAMPPAATCVAKPTGFLLPDRDILVGHLDRYYALKCVVVGASVCDCAKRNLKSCSGQVTEWLTCE